MVVVTCFKPDSTLSQATTASEHHLRSCRRHLHPLLARLVLAATYLLMLAPLAAAMCPSGCNGHGICTTANKYVRMLAFSTLRKHHCFNNALLPPCGSHTNHPLSYRSGL